MLLLSWQLDTHKEMAKGQPRFLFGQEVMTWIREAYLWLTSTKINVVFTSEIILGEDVEDYFAESRRIICAVSV